MDARLVRRMAVLAAVVALGGIGVRSARAGAVITAGDNSISYTGAIVDYTVLTGGIYNIMATGANGGSGFIDPLILNSQLSVKENRERRVGFSEGIGIG